MQWLINLWHKLRGARSLNQSRLSDVDDELLGAFLAEIDELVPSLRTALEAWRHNSQDAKALRELRRGFHTIKGAAPMVGAVNLGEFGKDLENLLIALAERPARVRAGANDVIAQAVELLPLFAQTLRTGRKDPPAANRIRLQAQNLLR